LGEEFKDADGTMIDAASEIFNASTYYKINPQVLLSTLQKENEAVSRKKQPPDLILKYLAGWDPSNKIVPRKDKSAQEQIWDSAKQLSRDFYNRLSQGKPTAGGWQVGWKGCQGSQSRVMRKTLLGTPLL
jgi:hypothetical protein